MRKYTKLNPTFMNEIMITETGDPGHADNINAGPKQIFENTLANKEEIEKGDSQNRIVTFTSNDNADAQSWTDVAVMESGEKHKNLFEKISTMFKNVRYLYRLLGTTDISAIQNGTVTGILNELDRVAFTGIYSDLHNKPLSLPASDVYSWAKQATKPSYAKSEVGLGKVDNTSDKDKPVSTEQQTALDKKVNFADISRSTAVNIAGKKVLDAMEKNALVEGTLAHDISQIYSNFNNYLPAYFEYVGSVEGIGNSLDIPRGAKELYIIGNTPYYSVPMLLTAGQLTMYETILGGGSHYVRFSVNRNGSGKIVITDAMQDGSISNNARIALWYR